MEKIFTVSEFNEFINTYLQSVGNVVVEGEISELKVNQNKWVFLTLKDNSTSLEAFGFLFNIKNINELAVGMKVTILGFPKLYQKTSRFSLQIVSVTPQGAGALKQAFELLKEKLEKEGLFDKERKRAISPFPKTAGLITAKDSQAYSDFIKVLNARYVGVKIFLFPSSVQGKESIQSIISAFEYFNNFKEHLDFVALIRGGGSLEDLASFNSEEVARAIFASKYPVAVGVGHEKDVTLADLVSDIRASTPSNCAELCFPSKYNIMDKADSYVKLFTQILSKNISLRLMQVDTLTQRIIKLVDTKLINQSNKLEGLVRILGGLSYRVSYKITEVENIVKKITNLVTNRLESDIAKVGSLSRVLNSLSYENVLTRGFSITYFKDGKILTSKTQVLPKDKLKTVLKDGEVLSEII